MISLSQVPEEDHSAEDADAHVAGVAGAQEGHGRLQDHDAADHGPAPPGHARPALGRPPQGGPTPCVLPRATVF